jgi:hypothetical protein
VIGERVIGERVIGERVIEKSAYVGHRTYAAKLKRFS